MGACSGRLVRCMTRSCRYWTRCTSGAVSPRPRRQSWQGSVHSPHRSRQRWKKGLPVYAECGGLIYLGRSLMLGETVYPMTSVLPADFVLEKKPQAHGYTQLETSGPNPFFEIKCSLLGHEFHYSRIKNLDELPGMAFTMRRGQGSMRCTMGWYTRTCWHLHRISMRSAPGMGRGAGAACTDVPPGQGRGKAMKVREEKNAPPSCPFCRGHLNRPEQMKISPSDIVQGGDAAAVRSISWTQRVRTWGP